MPSLLCLFRYLSLNSLASENIPGKKEVEETPPLLKRIPRSIPIKRTGLSRRRQSKRKIARKTKASIKRLKAEIGEIGAQQKRIKEGQREVRKKFKEIESECDQLKKETNFIMQHNAGTQLRLDLLLKILKAREEGDFATATGLTQSLRELSMKKNKKKQVLVDL